MAKPRPRRAEKARFPGLTICQSGEAPARGEVKSGPLDAGGEAPPQEGRESLVSGPHRLSEPGSPRPRGGESVSRGV